MASQSHSNPDHVRQPKPAIDDASYDDEPTKEDILRSIRLGLEQAGADQTRPAREALAEIRLKIASDVDTG